MPFIFKKAQKAVASFVIISIVLTLGLIILIGKGSGLFDLKYRYTTVIDETYDLKNGSPIKYKGLEVGTVSRIDLNQSDKIRLEVIIQRDFAKTHIKRDSVLKVEKQLLGSSFLKLIPSIHTNEPFLTPGSLVFSSDMPEGTRLIAAYMKANPAKQDEMMMKVNDILATVNTSLPDLMHELVGISRSLNTILAGLAGYSGADVSYEIKDILKNVDHLTDKDKSELLLLLKENLIEFKKVLQNLPFGMGSGKTKGSTSIQGGDR